MKSIIAFLAMIVALPAMAASDPEQLIKITSDKVLSEIRINADTYKSDPHNIFRLVDDVVLPHFDFSAMTSLALGRYRKKVTAEQKPAIVKEFRALLVRTYSSALLEYTDQKLVYLPLEGAVEDGRVVVKTAIEQADGFPIPIDYSMRLRDSGWKVVDISVDGVSLVSNYRSSFARAIRKNGVDGLIKTLQARNQK